MFEDTTKLDKWSKYVAIIDAIHFGKLCMLGFKLGGDQPTKRQDGCTKKICYF